MTNLLTDKKRLAEAKTFLMVPLWTGQAGRARAKCEHCGEAVAWDLDSASVMDALKTHLLCPPCTGLLMTVLGDAVESLGKLNGRTLTR